MCLAPPPPEKYQPCPTWEWVKLHVWMSHVTYTLHTHTGRLYKYPYRHRALLHKRSHLAERNIYARVMSHTCMGHVTLMIDIYTYHVEVLDHSVRNSKSNMEWQHLVASLQHIGRTHARKWKEHFLYIRITCGYTGFLPHGTPAPKFDSIGLYQIQFDQRRK